jgi:signal transduction histidine kinase
MRVRQGLTGDTAFADVGDVYLGLILALLLISTQYGMRALLLFSLGTPLLSVALAVPLVAAGGQEILTRSVQDASARLFLFTICGAIVVFLTRAQRKERLEEAKRHAQLAQYATTLEQLAVTRERNRLARDLHNTLAHTLSAVSVQLSALEVFCGTPMPRRRVRRYSRRVSLRATA